MSEATTIAATALVGLFTTSAVIIGATLGLYADLPQKLLAGMLAFAAGVLISSLGLELAYEGARELHARAFTTAFAWAFISGGFATGAVIYYVASRFLDRHGAAVRSPTRLREYVLERQQEYVKLLSRCDLLRHLPPEGIQDLLTVVHARHVPPARFSSMRAMRATRSTSSRADASRCCRRSMEWHPPNSARSPSSATERRSAKWRC